MSQPEQSQTTEKIKEIPLNKYSVHDLKAKCDEEIINFLEKNEFVENNFISNIRILIGLGCVVFTALSYAVPGTFEENYRLSLISVILYFILQFFAYLFESFKVNAIFYEGQSISYNSKINLKKKYKKLRFSSDIKEDQPVFILKIECVLNSGMVIESEEKEILCTQFVDEKGYFVKKIYEEIISNFLKDFLLNKVENVK